ncbi:phosphoadenylyl-sulfate reductase [Blochmannia endosymbiont of Camponotus (Colobopsis) obliquus]|uniref:phosphoadenylyl-sulfate reductase n=1 Tax=Blochmannia endosymbiont of Camponotus (Colobopsis) obliquus TaxID=1505597 RepID=UPI00061A5569|nr:phosphoadenylyl-sulfate reductase [Blochmannia endosymbiont of Camponotus (Colobopsis) obliquus]AKC60335.1 phosphoadenosine phosphosulfate reductase [Blochmannia endosymbiont of Camponotus (Colobopsis) obliquus]
MNKYSLNYFNSLNIEKQCSFLNKINLKLNNFTVEQRINWALEYLPKEIVLSSSFGVQSVVSLHLMIRQFPNIPVVLIDTGYLFPETYRFIDQLTEQLKLNLRVFRPVKSPAWQEARYGKLWKQGVQGIKYYNYINKVEPMLHALKKLRVGTWIAGVRRQQSHSRKKLMILSIQHHVFKLLPIVDWTNQQVHQYIKKYMLMYHPLWEQGYVSLGDIHTTNKWDFGISEEETRFFGLIRECGLHYSK